MIRCSIFEDANSIEKSFKVKIESVLNDRNFYNNLVDRIISIVEAKTINEISKQLLSDEKVKKRLYKKAYKKIMEEK